MHWTIKTALVLVAVAVGVTALGMYREHQQPVATAPGAPTVAASGSPLAPAPRVLQSDTRLIQQGQFYILSFNILRPAKITVSVTLKDGPPIDSYFVTEQGLNTWQTMSANGKGMTFPYRADLSMAPLAGEYSRTALVQPGKYAVIIDNSKFGATAPPFHFFKKSPALVAYTVSTEEP